MQHAAANWACFRAFQRALLGTYYGKNWIIQNNHITDARCAGIVCGNDPSHENEAFVVEETGHHVVRNNTIQRCGQAGIHGFKGWAASIIENNLIEDINTKDDFGGYETGGIKVHCGVDLLIRNNVVRRVHRGKSGEFVGIWVDWGAQGARVSGNIVYDMNAWPLFLQNNHGAPILADNNILAGPVVQTSDNCVLVHNLFVDCRFDYSVDNRDAEVVYYKPHSAEPAGIKRKHFANDHYLNNIFAVQGAEQIPHHQGYRSDWNVFYGGAKASSWGDEHSIVDSDFDAGVSFQSLDNGVVVTFNASRSALDVKAPRITRDFIGRFKLSGQGLETHDGNALAVDRDILGNKREARHPTAGPLEQLKPGCNRIRLLVGPTRSK